MVFGLVRFLQRRLPDEPYRRIQWVLPREPWGQLAQQREVLPLVESFRLHPVAPLRQPRAAPVPLSLTTLSTKCSKLSDIMKPQQAKGAQRSRPCAAGDT